jgi:hypothetical protein
MIWPFRRRSHTKKPVTRRRIFVSADLHVYRRNRFAAAA